MSNVLPFNATVDNLSDEALSEFAREAFLLGLAHGRMMPEPASVQDVAVAIQLPRPGRLDAAPVMRGVYLCGWSYGGAQRLLG